MHFTLIKNSFIYFLVHVAFLGHCNAFLIIKETDISLHKNGPETLMSIFRCDWSQFVVTES